MHNHRRRLFLGRFPNTTFLRSLCLPLKPGSHMPPINQRCSRPCRLSYFSDECEHASPATQAIAELYRRHAREVELASTSLDCLQSAFSLKIRLVLISSSAIVRHSRAWVSRAVTLQRKIRYSSLSTSSQACRR